MKLSYCLTALPLLFASVSLWQVHTELAASRTNKKEFKEKNVLHRILFKNKSKIFKKGLKAAKLYFSGDYGTIKHWRVGVTEAPEDQIRQKELFGYQLQIEHIIDTDPQMVHKPNRPTLYLHGWGDTKNSGKLMKKYLQILPGDLVTFDFPDAHGVVNLWHKASFAQLPDVLPALYTLNYIYEKLHPEAINLLGMSRGGGTAINLIAVLKDTTGTYDAYLGRMGIDRTRAQTLLHLIEHGTVVLDCPLLDMNCAVAHKMPRFIPRSWPAALLEKVSRYNPESMQALHSATQLEGLKLNILVHFQHNDYVVTNENEAQFYASLAQHDPKRTFLVLGDDGGHIHTHICLSRTVHSFQKWFGNSYDPNYTEAYEKAHYSDTIGPDATHPTATNPHALTPEGSSVLEAVLLQPQDPASCIAAFHAQCNHKRNQHR